MSDDALRRPLPPSVFARLAQATRYAITGVSPDTWFGPLQPLAPMAPPEVKGRQFDYPFGANLNYIPRAEDGISFAELRGLADALPLLRGIADGTLDPADAAVRERCARHAATLRRALTDPAQDAEGLLAELAPALRAASPRGMLVEVRVVGDPAPTPPEVASAALAAADGVMSVLPPQPVTLTVLASGDDVELYVTFGRPPPAAPDLAALQRKVPATAHWHAAVEVGDTGAGCLEVRWRKAVPA